MVKREETIEEKKKRFEKKETESFICYIEKGNKPVKEVILESKDKSFQMTIFVNKAFLDRFQKQK